MLFDNSRCTHPSTFPEDPVIVRNILVPTFSVVDSSSHLAYVDNGGRVTLNFASPRLCAFALCRRKRKVAKSQRRKDWKPQNPSESGNIKPQRAQRNTEGCYFYLLPAPCPPWFSETLFQKYQKVSWDFGHCNARYQRAEMELMR